LVFYDKYLLNSVILRTFAVEKYAACYKMVLDKHYKLNTLFLTTMKKIHNLKSVSLALGLILTLGVAPVQVVAQNAASAQTQQSYTIKGHVIDDEGEALPGVTIKRNGQAVGVTDAKGAYEISVPAGSNELEFRFIGMEPSIVKLKNVVANQAVEVTMKSDAGQLNEVVVTGYQDIAKPKMTGSAVTISGNDLMERYTPNLLSNLEGRVAGLSTYGGELKVRGTSSLYAETSPLLVVDGLPVEGRLEDINQYDIASINVLKDAAATAIYGARASNGVIVVTTKNAHQKGKIDVAFTANLTLKENRNMDYNDNFYMNAEQQVKKESEYYDWYYTSGTQSDPVGSTLSGYNYGNGPVSPLSYAYYRAYKGDITMDELAQIKQQLSKNNFAKEYAREVYRQQVMQEYNLSLRSRSEKSQNNLTLNFAHDNAGIINTMDQRFTANYKGSFDVTKWLTTNVTINGVFNKSRGRGDDATSLANDVWSHAAYETMYNADGSIRNMYGICEGNELWGGGGEGTVDLSSNPIDEFYNNTVNSRRTHLRLNGELLFRILPGLTASVMGVYESDQQRRVWLATEDSHPARVLHNAYYDPNRLTNPLIPATGGFRQTRNTQGDYWTTRGQLNYGKKFGKHEVSAIAGLEFRGTLSKGTNSLLLAYDDQLQTGRAADINFFDLYDQQYSPYYKSGSGGYNARSYAYNPYIKNGMDNILEVEHRYGSGYFNATYTYNDRYNVFASFRKDYADVYGLNSKYRGKPLWSVGGAWNIEQEDFMKEVKWVNFLKLRYSYGATGNIYQGATSYLTATTGSTNSYTKLPLATIQSPANPNLRWEQTRTNNVGIDFSLFNNRVRGSIDYYHKAAQDVFANKSLDPTTGYSSMFVNSANLRNNGIELQVTADWFRPTTRKQIGWSTSLTLAHNSNKVTNVYNPSTYAYQMLSNPFVEGYPASALWSYRFAGIDDGSVSGPGETLWYGDGGTITHSVQGASTDVMEYSGQTDPKVILGMDNRLEWNGFSFSIMLAYYGGHVMRCLQEREVTSTSMGGTQPLYLLNSWTPENPTTTPGFGQYGSSSIGNESYNGNNSVYDASFLKIRNIVFGYEFPRTIVNRLKLSRLALNFQIDNPKALWTANGKGIDPETLSVRTRSNYTFSLFVNY
jgi:TonB-linked SusC/RagA family outer membrane protein